MGLFSSCFAIRDVTQEDVVAVFRTHFPEHDAFISPQFGRWTLVFDADSGIPLDSATPLIHFAGSLTAACNKPGLALMFIRYTINYWLFSATGSLVDWSEAFDPVSPEERHGLLGDFDRMSSELGLSVDSAAIRHALTFQHPLGVTGNYLAFCAALGLPLAHFSYLGLFSDCDFFTDEEIPGWSAFVHAGMPDPRGL
jgi:hypothetical protein